MKIFHAVSRYDRTKHPEKKPYRLMTVEEAKQLRSGSTVLARGNDGRIANVKVNGKPKTWKTRPGDVDVPWKFGMYEYGTARFRNGESDGFLVVDAEDDSLPANPPKRSGIIYHVIDSKLYDYKGRELPKELTRFRTVQVNARLGLGTDVPEEAIIATFNKFEDAVKLASSLEDRMPHNPPKDGLTTKEKILLSAFQAHDTLFLHDIPGHFSLTVADLIEKGLVVPHPIHKAAWQLTKKGRLFRSNPPEVDESGQSGGVHIDVYQNNPPDTMPIRSGFMNELNQEKIVTARETLLGFITIKHGGKHLKVLIDVRKYPDGNLHISTRYHRPGYMDQVGPVLSQMDAEIDSRGVVHGRNTGKRKYAANPPLTEVYRDIIEIRARKSDGRLYKHPFGKGAAIYGMPDGSLLVKSRKGKRLWKNFPKGNK